MKAVYFPGNKQVEVREVPTPKPGPREVLIRLQASAICRSDMSLYYGNSDPVVGSEDAGKGTIIPGHEPAGIVEAVGQGVTSVKAGDRVAVYLAIGCMACSYCLSGYRMLCANWKCVGFDVHGGDADYMVVPEINCLPLPDSMSFEVAAVSTDAVGTLYHAQKRLGISGRDTLTIFGLGPMGMAGVLVAKAAGANIIAVDLVDHRLQLAKELGVDHVINGKEADVVNEILKLTNGAGPDAVIDCTGSPICHNQAFDVLRRQGRGAFIGEAKETTIKPSDQFIRKQINVIGSWYFPIHEWGEITDFIVRKQIPVERLITHRFSINEAEKAFRMFDERKTEKAVFTWS
jgi:threonine dehydrogenase-like Zn-dependent dehydrogenase